MSLYDGLIYYSNFSNNFNNESGSGVLSENKAYTLNVNYATDKDGNSNGCLDCTDSQTLITWLNEEDYPSANGWDSVPETQFPKNENFNISLWFYASSTSNNRVLIGGGTSGDTYFVLYFYNNTLRCRIQNADGLRQAEDNCCTSTISTGQWYFFSINFFTTYCKTKLNNETYTQYNYTSNSGTADGSYISGNLNIGGWSWVNVPTATDGSTWSTNTSLCFNGYLDEIRIYNRTLSETEIDDIYALGTPTTPPEDTGGSSSTQNGTIILL